DVLGIGYPADMPGPGWTSDGKKIVAAALLSFSQTRSECIQRQESSALRSSTHTAESRKADGQKESRGSEEGSDFFSPHSRGHCFGPSLPNRRSELQTDGRPRLNQPRTRFTAST